MNVLPHCGQVHSIVEEEEFVGEVPPLDGSESKTTQRSDPATLFCLLEIWVHSFTLDIVYWSGRLFNVPIDLLCDRSSWLIGKESILAVGSYPGCVSGAGIAMLPSRPG
jgi:hypothetical protein